MIRQGGKQVICSSIQIRTTKQAASNTHLSIRYNLLPLSKSNIQYGNRRGPSSLPSSPSLPPSLPPYSLVQTQLLIRLLHRAMMNLIMPRLALHKPQSINRTPLELPARQTRAVRRVLKEEGGLPRRLGYSRGFPSLGRHKGTDRGGQA